MATITRDGKTYTAIRRADGTYQTVSTPTSTPTTHETSHVVSSGSTVDYGPPPPRPPSSGSTVDYGPPPPKPPSSTPSVYVPPKPASPLTPRDWGKILTSTRQTIQEKRYGLDPRIVQRYEEIRSGLTGRGQNIGAQSARTRVSQDISRSSVIAGLANAQAALIQGNIEKQNTLVEQFNKKTFSTQEEADAALEKLNKQLAPYQAKEAKAREGYAKLQSQIITTRKGLGETLPIIAAKEQSQLQRLDQIRLADERIAYERLIAKETGQGYVGGVFKDNPITDARGNVVLQRFKLSEPAKRVLTPTAIGAGVGGAVLGPVGFFGGAAVGSVYGTTDIFARSVVSTEGQILGPLSGTYSELGGVSERQIRRSEVATPGSYTVLPVPTAREFAVLNTEGFKEVSPVSEMQFKLPTASGLAFGASLAGAGPLVEGGAKWLTKPLVNIQTTRTLVEIDKAGDFKRFLLVEERPLSRSLQLGPVSKSTRLDVSRLGLADGKIPVKVGGEKALYQQDIRVVQQFEGGRTPYRTGELYEDVRVLSKGGRAYSKEFKLDFMGRIKDPLSSRLTKADTISGDVFGLGKGFKLSGTEAGGINLGVSLPTGKAPTLFAQPYIIRADLGVGGFQGAAGGITKASPRSAQLLDQALKSSLELSGGALTSVGTATKTSSLGAGLQTTGLFSMSTAAIPGLTQAQPKPVSIPQTKTAGLNVEMATITLPKTLSLPKTKIVSATISKFGLSQTAVSSMSITSSQTKTISATISEVEQATATSPLTSTLITPITTTITTPITTTITKPLTTSPIQNIFSGYPGPPAVPLIPTAPLLGKDIGGGGSGGGFWGTGKKQKRKYQPSIEALFEGITGPQPKGILSGIGLRPIPRKSKK